VRCADETIATKYYSNTVTVHLAESWGEICKANPCQFTFDITKQINLKYENNKPTSSDNLTMKVVGKGNLYKFQKTFARIKIDNTIIQDITIPDSGVREFTISNLWSKLPAQTKTNIENTLKTYKSAKVNVVLEV